MAVNPLTPRSTWTGIWNNLANAANSRPVRYLHIGDSITEGYASTLVNVTNSSGTVVGHMLKNNWPAREQIEFENKWLNPGTFTPFGFEFVNALYRFNGPNPVNASVTYGNGGKGVQNDTTHGGLIGKAKIMKPGATFTLVRYATQIGILVNHLSTTNSFTVTVDGVTKPVVTNKTGIHESLFSNLSSTVLHTITVTFSDSVTSSPPPYFMGVSVYRGTENKGFQVWSGGYSGSYTAQFTGGVNGVAHGRWEDVLPIIQPDFVTISWLTNDLTKDNGNKIPSVYQTNTLAMIDMIRDSTKGYNTVSGGIPILIQVPQELYWNQTQQPVSKNKYIGSYTWQDYLDTNYAVASLRTNVYVEPMSNHVARGVNLSPIDTIHPTDTGYATYGQMTMKTLNGDFNGTSGGGGTADTSTPTTPTGLKVTSSSASTVALSWTVSTDNVGVTGYRIFKDTVLMGTSTTTTYVAQGLKASTAYNFTVQAMDQAGNYSGLAAVNATTPAAADTVAPSTPTNLAAGTKTSTTIPLTWSASTDNVAVKNYVLYKNGAAFTTSTSPAYTMSQLTPATTYSFYVTAMDAAGNTSAKSNTLTITTAAAPDTTQPSVPGTVTVSNITQTSLQLSWGASTDNVAVIGYTVYKDGQPLSQTITSTSTTITGLSAGTSYAFVVKAYDAAGNESDGTASLDVTTSQPPDTIPPTVPTNLSLTGKTQTSISFSWTVPSDNTGVTGYQVLINGAASNTTTSPSYTAGSLTAGTTYSFTVKAHDASNNYSGASQALVVTTTAAPDTTAPTVPSGLSKTSATQTSITLSWTASTDAVGVAGYKVYQDGVVVATNVPSTSYTVRSLSPGSSYDFVVKAFDNAGNLSAGSGLLTASTSAAVDTTDPTAASGLAVSSKTDTTVNLSWTNATDNVAVTGYYVYINGTQRGNVTTNSYSATGLTGATSYQFYVRAYDAAQNIGPASSAITVTTNATPDTTDPTAPTNLTASSITQTGVTLTWTVSTDNVSVRGYQLYKDGQLIQTGITANSITLNNLIAATGYVFYVRAYDAAGNIGSPSGSIQVTTAQPPATIPPDAPNNLTLTAKAPTTISLSWTLPSTSTGVTGYNIYQDGTQVGTTTSTNYTVSGLSPMTSYAFVIKAYNASNVEGNGSQALTVVTPAAADTTAPTVPNGIIQTAAASDSISLSWNPSTDAVGVTGYRVFKDGVFLAAVTTPSYTATGLSGGTSYAFVVKAYDIAGNLSAGSGAFTATTDDSADGVAPSVPNGFVDGAITDSAVTFSWSPSTDAVGVTGYKVFKDGVLIDTVTVTSYTATGLSPATTYAFVIKAFDEAQNVSAGSGAHRVTTTVQADTSPPTIPTGLSAASITANSFTLSWNSSTDTVGVAGYFIYRNGAQIASTQLTSLSISGLAAGTSYGFVVIAYDFAGNKSAGSASLTVKTLAAVDLQKPTIPQSLTSSNVAQDSVDLAWQASTDNVGVTGYNIYQDNQLLDTTVSTHYTVTNLDDSTSYRYYVSAFDAAGNISNPSNTAIVSTLAPVDNSSPTAPSNLAVVNADVDSINLQWAVPSDNVGVVDYLVFKNGAQVATATTNSVIVDNLEPATTYGFVIKARDAAQNVGPGSKALYATTDDYVDTEAPTAPSGLAASLPTFESISLTWNASTDNVGVDNYTVFVNGEQFDQVLTYDPGDDGDQVPSPTYTYIATGLNPSTNYEFYVIAYDAAGNASNGSNVINAATSALPLSSTLKWWNGTAWVAKPLKVWNGTAWVTKPLTIWNSSSWL